jgi:hypothetical protein
MTANAPPVDLTPLFDSMVANLTEQGVTAAVVFGRREAAKQINQGFGRANRVVFEFGDPNGKMGTPEAGRNPGGNPRPVGRLAEIGTVYCWARDNDKPNDERAQYVACRALYGSVFQALRNAGFGNLRMGDPELVADNPERLFGCECRFTVTFGTAILNTANPTLIVASDDEIELATGAG